MSAATIAIVVEGLLLALALLFVLALLRSHAEILRRLSALEGGAPVRDRPATSGDRDASAVSDVVGETLAGDAVKLGLGPGSARTLLAFLSSGCVACEPLWAGLHEPIALPSQTRLVVVTKGPKDERVARLRKLAPADAEVVMSSQAWQDFAVPATPHFVLAGGENGDVLGRGSAGSWSQIMEMVDDADEDGALYRARSTEQRAARAEQALAAAGIGPGHPSLHPSRERDADE
ncbi:MAG: hypothetical protein WAK93_09680 [Solirubrobacteraceae bacterium]